MPDTAILIALGAVIGTTILLALGLIAGFWAGLQAATRSLVEELSALKLENAGKTAQLNALDSEIQSTHEQSEVVGLLARASHDRLPSELAVAIESMVESVRSLEKKLQNFQPPESRVRDTDRALSPVARWGEFTSRRAQLPQQPLRVVEKSAAQEVHLTTQEMCDVIGGRHRLGESTEEMKSRRYPYDCLQQLAPWDEEGPQPRPDSYVSVRCHDISVSGISFLWSDAPDFTRAILSVGAPEAPIFMVVEVTGYKSVYRHDEVCFLVGCRFVNRLEKVAKQTREEPDFAGV